jgi:hypothetical protein
MWMASRSWRRLRQYICMYTHNQHVAHVSQIHMYWRI